MMATHCVAKLFPLCDTGRLMSAIQALIRALDLLGNSTMHIDSEPLAESADARTVVSADPDPIALCRHLDAMETCHLCLILIHHRPYFS